MELKAQRTVFALETMDEVTLVKVTEFKPVENAKEAMEQLGGDATAFLAVVNDGLRSRAQKSLISNPSIPWMQEDDEGKTSEFSGTVADSKSVNNLVLTLAKTVFGYEKGKPVEEKRAAKESALEFIRNSEQMKAGLQKNAASGSAVE